MKRFSCFLLLALPLISPAQSTLRLTHGCGYDRAADDRVLDVEDGPENARRIVQEMLDALGLEHNFAVKSARVSSVSAIMDGGVRYLLISPAFLQRREGDSPLRWAAYTALAHEVGHHLERHDLTQQDPALRRRMELEADRFAGSALCRLGASATEARAGIESFAPDVDAPTHPSKTLRRTAVLQGWTEFGY